MLKIDRVTVETTPPRPPSREQIKFIFKQIPDDQLRD